MAAGQRIPISFGDKLHENAELTFILEAESSGGRRRGIFLCGCGGVKEIAIYRVSTGATLSCGCLQRKTASERRKSHGLSQDPLYGIWSMMKRRCYNEGEKAYKNYGGRGIQVCDRWVEEATGFTNFYNDMAPRPSPKHTLDRVDTNSDYSAENCKWSLRPEQNFNKRKSEKNTTGVTGVWYDKSKNHYQAYINKAGKRHYLGVYDDFNQAVNARRKAEIDLYGYNNDYL